MARALVYQSTNQLVATDSIAAEAHEAASRALLLDPTHADAQLALGINPEQPVYALLAEVKLAAGDAALALELLQHETDARARSAGLALVYFALGRHTEADTELAALENRSANDAAFGIARIHVYRREIDQAFAWLDRAVVQRDPECSDIKNDPLLQNLRGDNRYKLLLQKMQLPE